MAYSIDEKFREEGFSLLKTIPHGRLHVELPIILLQVGDKGQYREIRIIPTNSAETNGKYVGDKDTHSVYVKRRESLHPGWMTDY